MVSRLAEKIRASDVAEFAKDVLGRLPFYMEERKKWVFIACFCGDSDSRLHRERYGQYCMKFPAPWTAMPSLALPDPKAEFWYQRVIYDEEVQRNAIKRAVASVTHAISEQTSGQNKGPWAPMMIDQCAKNVAQQLLSLAIAFKRPEFRDEREWRIVCAPPLGTNSSAPTSIDEEFAVNIRASPCRHVSLKLNQRTALFEPMLIPPVPFLSWEAYASQDNTEELEKINLTLKNEGRADLCLIVATPVTRKP